MSTIIISNRGRTSFMLIHVMRRRGWRKRIIQPIFDWGRALIPIMTMCTGCGCTIMIMIAVIVAR